MAPLVSVLIPTRAHESFAITAESLLRQTIQDFEIITVVDHDLRGQSWARNQAAQSARGRYTLFSDADIDWQPTALEILINTLETAESPPGWSLGYAYCAYQLTGKHSEVISTMCNRHWSWTDLIANPYISTMSLVKTELIRHFPFDETLRRLEDWELWLRMGLSGFAGTYCGRVLFQTAQRTGVTFNGPVTHEAAERQIRFKLSL